MNDIKISKLNEVYFQIECEIGIKYELTDYFKCYVPGYKYHPKYKLHLWDGRVSFFDSRYSVLPIGLYPFLQKFCQEYNYKYEFDFDPKEFRNSFLDEELQSFYEVIFKDSKNKIRPRDYQHELIKSAINSKRGILLSATASGKSCVLYTLIRFFLSQKKRVLLIVPNIQLVEQMFTEFSKEYGWKDTDKYVTKLHNQVKNPDFNRPVLVSTFQSLKKKDMEFFDRYGAVLVDETHQAKTVSIKNILVQCRNAEYRIGTTGTMKRELSDHYTITGYLGPVLKEVKTKELQERGFLADIKIRNIILKYPESFIKGRKGMDYNEEKKLVYGHLERDKVLKLIFSKIPDGQNSLILIENLWHIETVKSYIEANFDDKYQLFIISGEVEADVREHLRQLMETQSNVILLATYGTLSTGVSIKNIENIVLYSSSRSEIRILQSLGRGLRMREGKRLVVIWDIIDSFCYLTRNGNLVKNYLFKHWAGSDESDYEIKQGRMDFYKEQGFESKVLEKNLEEI